MRVCTVCPRGGGGDLEVSIYRVEMAKGRLKEDGFAKASSVARAASGMERKAGGCLRAEALAQVG